MCPDIRGYRGGLGLALLEYVYIRLSRGGCGYTDADSLPSPGVGMP